MLLVSGDAFAVVVGAADLACRCFLALGLASWTVGFQAGRLGASAQRDDGQRRRAQAMPRGASPCKGADDGAGAQSVMGAFRRMPRGYGVANLDRQPQLFARVIYTNSGGPVARRAGLGPSSGTALGRAVNLSRRDCCSPKR